jgi:hypothetical protein
MKILEDSVVVSDFSEDTLEELFIELGKYFDEDFSTVLDKIRSSTTLPVAPTPDKILSKKELSSFEEEFGKVALVEETGYKENSYNVLKYHPTVSFSQRVLRAVDVLRKEQREAALAKGFFRELSPKETFAEVKRVGFEVAQHKLGISGPDLAGFMLNKPLPADKAVVLQSLPTCTDTKPVITRDELDFLVRRYGKDRILTCTGYKENSFNCLRSKPTETFSRKIRKVTEDFQKEDLEDALLSFPLVPMGAEEFRQERSRLGDELLRLILECHSDEDFMKFLLSERVPAEKAVLLRAAYPKDSSQKDFLSKDEATKIVNELGERRLSTLMDCSLRSFNVNLHRKEMSSKFVGRLLEAASKLRANPNLVPATETEAMGLNIIRLKEKTLKKETARKEAEALKRSLDAKSEKIDYSKLSAEVLQDIARAMIATEKVAEQPLPPPRHEYPDLFIDPPEEDE